MTDETLKERRIVWKVGFEEKNLKPKPDLVITTGAHGGLTNPEVLLARKLGVEVLTQAQAIGKFMSGKEGISVCGVGGKTTVSAMIATVLDFAHQKPSYAIGVGRINPLGFPGQYAQGLQFVAEADEYVNSPGVDNRVKFLFQKPRVIVVTNIEFDHPDVYQNLDHTKEIFKKFFVSLPEDGLLIACWDNPHIKDTIKGLEVNLQTYGLSPLADWKIEKIYFGQEQTLFDLYYQGGVVSQIKLKVPGRFNVLNAVAAFAVGTFLGLDAQTIKEGLGSFGGTKRRFEFIKEINGIKLYDDYAHHPREIEATLKAAKQWFPGKRLIVVFQPHTYSRTKALLDDFSRVFSMADFLVITNIYSSAREKDNLGVSGKLLAAEVKKHHPRVSFQSGEKEVTEYLSEIARKGDIIFTMGAGNIFLWHRSIIRAMRSKR